MEQTGKANDDRLLLRGGEVADTLGISRALAYRYMQEGTLPTVRFGRAVRVPKVALLRWIDQRTVGSVAA